MVSINNTEVEPLDHKQIVGMIQSSSTQYGQLNLVVRKPPGGSGMDIIKLSTYNDYVLLTYISVHLVLVA